MREEETLSAGQGRLLSERVVGLVLSLRRRTEARQPLPRKFTTMSHHNLFNLRLVALVVALGLGASMTYSGSASADEDQHVEPSKIDDSNRGEPVKPEIPAVPFNPPPQFEPAKNK